MPKQQLNLTRFEGGLNTDGDPRDIANNEFSALTGVSLDEIGMIRLIGGPATATGTNLSGNLDLVDATSLVAGYSLFTFNSDYDDSGALVSTNYVVNYDAYKGWINIYDSAGAWNAETTGEELIYPEESRTFSTGSNWSNAGGDNAFASYDETTSGQLTVTPDDVSDVQYAYLEDDYWQTGMVDGRKYRLTYDIHISSYTKGTLSVGFSSDATPSVMTSAKTDYTATNGSGASATLDFTYAGANHERLTIYAAANTVFTADFDNFSIKPITIHTGADDAPPSTSNAMPNFYAPNGVLRFCDGIFSNVDREPTWFGAPIKSEYAPAVADTSGGSCEIGGSWKRYDSSIESTTFVTSETTSDNSNSPHSNLIMHNNLADAVSSGTMQHRTLNHFSTSDERYAQATWGLGITFSDAYSWQTNGSGGWQPNDSVYYKFYATFVYDGIGFPSGQESHPKEFLMYATQTDASSTDGLVKTTSSGLRFYKDAQDGANSDTGVANGIQIFLKPILRLRSGTDAADHYVFGKRDALGTAQSYVGGNERITGCRIYYSEAGSGGDGSGGSDEGHNTLWLMMDLDFAKGALSFGKAGSSGGYSPWAATSVDNISCFGDETVRWVNPPKIETYEGLNGYKHNERLNAKWKTSVLANGRVYIGNIKRQKLSTFDGGGSWSATQADDPEYQDRICRSPVDKFDTFPESNDIELADSNDGDAIIKLEEYADRLFIFKKYSLVVLNIANDANIVEGSYPYLGLDGGYQCQSVRTDHGIAWINQSGVYFYDGNNINPLSESKIFNVWDGTDVIYTSAFWDTGNIPSIGYDPLSKKLIISNNVDSSGDEHALVYDFKLKNWIFDQNTWTNDTNKSNFIVYRNELIWMEAGTTNVAVKKWSDAPSDVASGDLHIWTKDFDFGSPNVRKKIHKVYITYDTGNSTSNVLVSYGTDGTTNPAKTFANGTNFSSSELAAANGWQRAVLKPSSSAEANNIYSFRMRFTCDGTVPAAFKINDITIIYRMKAIK